MIMNRTEQDSMPLRQGNRGGQAPDNANLRKLRSIGLPVIIFLGTTSGVTVYEFSKELISNGVLSAWESHLITIIVTSIFAVVASLITRNWILLLNESLKNMATKFLTMYESSSDAIMLFDETGFFDCNPATLRMFCCPTRDDFIGKHPSQFSPPAQPGGEDSLSLAKQHIATAFRSGSNRFEWMHRRINGADFPAEVLLIAMELDGRQVLQATVRDITERKQSEAKLIEQIEELRRWYEITSNREGRILDLK